MGEVVQIAGMEVTFFDLNHGDVPTTSALFEYHGSRIAVAYDTGPELPPGVEAIIRNAEIGVTEAAYPDSMPSSSKHLRTSEAIELGRQLGWKETYLTHISHFSPAHEILAEQVRKSSGGHAVVAFDGLEVSA
jgi:ribonuclease BN (tRNA processing enzyme)